MDRNQKERLTDGSPSATGPPREPPAAHDAARTPPVSAHLHGLWQVLGLDDEDQAR